MSLVIDLSAGNPSFETINGTYRQGSIYSGYKDVTTEFLTQRLATAVNTIWVKRGTVNVEIWQGDDENELNKVSFITVLTGQSILIPVDKQFIGWKSDAAGVMHLELSVSN